MPCKDPEARKAYQREYAQRNREAAYARVKEWRTNNPGARTEEARKYREKYPEKCLAKTYKWIEKNPEKHKESQRKSAAKQRSEKPDAIKARKQLYAKTNKGVVNAAVARRKAAKLLRTPAWSDGDKIKAYYAVCAFFNEVNGFIKYHVDHDYPLQGDLVSGLHVHNNLRIIPWQENVSKKNKFEVCDGRS